MKDEFCQRIRSQYLASGGDSTALFEAILSVAGETGLEPGLACLEECVTQKRLAWLERNAGRLARTGDPLRDGFDAFYTGYLGLSIPRDGEIVEAGPRRIVSRWWNACPTLEACKELGLDTRQVCRLAYHGSVQDFLSRLDTRLRFSRNYAALRPYAPYCEEIIELEENNASLAHPPSENPG